MRFSNALLFLHLLEEPQILPADSVHVPLNLKRLRHLSTSTNDGFDVPGVLANAGNIDSMTIHHDVQLCNLKSDNPDIGILSCGSGNYCKSDDSSPIGGVCESYDHIYDVVNHDTRRLSCGGGMRYATFYYQKLCNRSSAYFTDEYGFCLGCDTLELLSCAEFCEEHSSCEETNPFCPSPRRRRTGGAICCQRKDYFVEISSNMNTTGTVTTTTTFNTPPDWESWFCRISKVVCKDAMTSDSHVEACYHYDEYRPYCDYETATEDVPCGVSLDVMQLNRCYVNDEMCNECSNDDSIECFEFDCTNTIAMSAGESLVDSRCDQVYILDILNYGILVKSTDLTAVERESCETKLASAAPRSGSSSSASASTDDPSSGTDILDIRNRRGVVSLLCAILTMIILIYGW